MSISYQLVELRAPEACHLTCFVNRAGELLGEWNRLRPAGFPSGRSDLQLFYFVIPSSLVPHGFSCSQGNSTEARLVFAMISVNADVRGPQRTTARVGDYSAGFGHQRRQIIFRCAVRGHDHENDWAPHSRRCQHMMALPAERCKIDYGGPFSHPLGAAVARSPERSVGERRRRRGMAHPLGGLEHHEVNSQFKPGLCVV